jgi:hypothetical protein
MTSHKNVSFSYELSGTKMCVFAQIKAHKNWLNSCCTYLHELSVRLWWCMPWALQPCSCSYPVLNLGIEVKYVHKPMYKLICVWVFWINRHLRKSCPFRWVRLWNNIHNNHVLQFQPVELLSSNWSSHTVRCFKSTIGLLFWYVWCDFRLDLQTC